MSRSGSLTRSTAKELWQRWLLHPVVRQKLPSEEQARFFSRMNRAAMAGYEWKEPRLFILPKQIKPLARGLARVGATGRRVSELGLDPADRLARRFEDYLSKNIQAILARGLRDISEELNALYTLKIRKARRSDREAVSERNFADVEDVLEEIASAAWGSNTSKWGPDAAQLQRVE